ncbi:polyprenyl synthetase family protein [Rhodohalobacter mucosus]|uniref:Polyprenyl synthetase family protein n=1 Tax=Rhodohalobacter mucosus TaxID=2079485 RepID=A0A316TWY3_9BACT|nr:polyprenyl synthetase family protein [Rhodohalobacter mucosus]PWN07084.1 polyprenyl synthetase family protein [Rhodohalobacter mucosus]
MEFLKPYTALIENRLQSLPLPQKPSGLYDPQRYILGMGGKRIRPMLSLVSCGLCGVDMERAVPAALSVELIHNFTLLHDDIMDQADSRRGHETVHRRWDVASAILAGDGMFVQALLMLQDVPPGCDHKQMMNELLTGVNTVCEGQALDMEFENRQDVSLGEYLTMIEGKTGALLSTSMKLGGYSAGADEDQIRLLDQIGRSLGLAFQIQDDLLDVIADPSQFGKIPAGDIREGKKTFLMLTALEHCSVEQKKSILGYFQKRPLTVNQIDEIISIYRSTGTIEEAEKQIGSYYKRAESALDKFVDSNYKQDLSNLINYLKNREI